MSAFAVLSAGEIESTAAWIASVQRGDGLIPWTTMGTADPWNHVESAMALDVAGRHLEARRAYEYLLGRQRPDGAFAADLNAPDGGRVDTNTVAYLAVGLFHHLISTGDDHFARAAFPSLDDAISYVLRHQLPGGAIAWNIDPGPDVARRALVAGSSSIAMSLRAGARFAACVGSPVEKWAAAAATVAAAVVNRTSEFFDNAVFAMDWYYPVLSGALRGEQALEHLDVDACNFVTPFGVRCRSDARWVTTAETAETAIAYAIAGDRASATRLLATLGDKRRPSGAYLTGLVYPERSEFPIGEETTYSAAAVVLAADLLSGGVATT
ncbi:MAG TPA: hypothetical protein VG368_05175, partial [Acidimicrobiales bacterium]|nr:hypothetical protein [Acidimicrobiales bacterium]